MNSNVVIKSLVVFVIINFLGIACCGPFDDPREFKVDDYALILQEDITDHTLPDRLLLLGDSVISDRLQLLLQPSTKFISDVTRQGGWTKAALACSPPFPVATQNFTSINVSSNADYVLSNDTIKAGESLNSIIKVMTGDSLNEFINEQPASYFYTLGLQFDSFAYNNDMHQFTVSVMLSDSSAFLITSNPIKIY